MKRLEWRFKTTWKPNALDIEAYNAIINFKDMQETKNLSENELFAKMWIHQLMLLARSRMYTADMCQKTINDILKISVYDWCLILKEEIPMMRFNAIGNHKYQLKEDDYFNITKIRERNEKIIDEFETELTRALKTEISEEKIIKFVKEEITKAIHAYEK